MTPSLSLSSFKTDRTPFFEVMFERAYLRTIRPAFVALGLCLAQSMWASAACVVLAGTADGFDKKTAVSRAQSSLEEYIQKYKTENHLGEVTVKAMRAEPQPYWRGRVSENMMYLPISWMRNLIRSVGKAWSRLMSALQGLRSAGRAK
jgi:hypothetical protein